MNRSLPGLPVHHKLLEFTQTHAHRVGDAIQPSHPLSSPSPPSPNPSKHQGLFQCILVEWIQEQVAKQSWDRHYLANRETKAPRDKAPCSEGLSNHVTKEAASVVFNLLTPGWRFPSRAHRLCGPQSERSVKERLGTHKFKCPPPPSCKLCSSYSHGSARLGLRPVAHLAPISNAESKGKLRLSWWLRGKEFSCQCRRHWLDPQSGKIPHAVW